MALLTNINGKFSVSDAGAVTFNNAFTFPTADGTANYVLKTNGSGQLAWAADNNTGGTVKGTGTATRVAFWSASDTITSDANLYWDNTNNRLGIGEASPNEKLHVNGGTANVVANFESTDAKAYISFKDSSTTNTDTVFLGAEGNNMTFYAGSASSERMRIDSSGNVGINDNIGKGKLAIKTSGTFTIDSNDGDFSAVNIVMKTDNTATNAVGSGIVWLKGGNDARKVAAITNYTYGDTDQSGLNFYVQQTSSGSSATLSEAMRIDNSGNIGIGDTGPSVKLQVSTSSPTNNVAVSIGDGWVGNSSYHKEGGLLLVSGTSQDATQTGAGIAFQTRNTGNTNYWKSSMIMDRDGAIRFTLGGAGTVAGSEDFTILSGGNVGIGNTGPTSQLQVGPGTTNATRSLIASLGGTSNSMLSTLSLVNTAGNDTIGNGAAIDFHVASTYSPTARIAGIAETTSVDTGLAFYTYSSGNLGERMRVDSLGNVGIGETSPSSKLEVRSETATHKLVSLNRAASTTAAMYLGNDSVNNAIISSNYSDLIFGRDQSSTLSEWMRIKRDGNVGIGTASPGYKLQVGDNGLGDGNITMKANSVGVNAGAKLTFNMNVGGGNADSYIAQIVPISYDSLSSGTHNSLNFKVGTWNNNADAGVSRMTILSNGNIGIGTTDPGTARLAVIGGNVGIGTTSPGYTLEIAGPSTTSFAYQRTGVSANKWGFHSDNDATYWQNLTSGNLLFTLQNGGNVGIGTTSPNNYKLEVNGNVKGDSFGTDQNTTARIFAPSGAAYDGSGTQTGYLIIKLPDNGAGGVNNMMSGLIRVFDYAGNESFDVHFAGYWYSGYNWTNCTAWIESQSNIDRNFNVRFGAMTGAAGSGTRPYITIGEGNSTWSYCKFSVMEYTSGHSNMNLYKWNSGWEMDLSSTVPGVTARTNTNCQVNNWARNGQDLYYGSGTGNVGIGDTAPTSLSVNTSSLTVNSTRTDLSGALFQKSNGVIKFQQYWATAGIIADVSAGDYFWKLANVNKMGLDTGTGALTVVGDVVAYGSPSDKRLKENIKPIESALDKVSKLQGVTFDWIQKEDQILDIKEDIGFIAQDVQKVIPELVRENDNGMLSMRHQGIAPILLEAIKELKAEIEGLKKCKCDCKR